MPNNSQRRSAYIITSIIVVLAGGILIGTCSLLMGANLDNKKTLAFFMIGITLALAALTTGIMLCACVTKNIHSNATMRRITNQATPIQERILEMIRQQEIIVPPPYSEFPEVQQEIVPPQQLQLEALPIPPPPPIR